MGVTKEGRSGTLQPFDVSGVTRDERGILRYDDIAAFGTERIAGFKVPQYVSFRADPLPRNPGGKVLKPRLREETDWGAAPPG